MTDDAQRIFDYLPVSFRNPTEQEYVNFLWDTFQTNYDAGKYPFAFLAYHMLFMCFVYFEIWQVKANFPDDFSKAMVGFNKDTEKELMEAATPFSLWQVNESSVFRFLKLIGMSNADIGQCTKLVKERNDAAHSNGNIFFRNQADVHLKINDVLRCVEKIQGYSQQIIETCFEKFLLESADIDNREFLDDTDQIREVLVHGNYLSARDIEIAKAYDFTRLAANQHFQNIESLALALRELYPDEETTEVGHA